MKQEYERAKMKSGKNPNAQRLKKQLTLRLDPEAMDYFKKQSDKNGIPYQTFDQPLSARLHGVGPGTAHDLVAVTGTHIGVTQRLSR